MLKRVVQRRFLSFPSARERSDFDVVIVGAGPAGLSAAIRLKQREPSTSVVVLEKASQVGGHSVSGAVIEPRALDELFPDWRTSFENDKCPLLFNPVTKDSMKFLVNDSLALSLPTPPVMHNSGNFIASLSEFVRWLGRRAEEVGVEIFPGFGAIELVFNEAGQVTGVATNDVGLSKTNEPKANYERGLELDARQAVLLAEGCHGSLSKAAIAQFSLREGREHQTYGLGLKEVWELPQDSAVFEAGKVVHSVGWPLDSQTYGGAFMYHFRGTEGQNLVSIGLVVGLDYSNPYLSPYGEFQRLKLHPLYRSVLQEGKCIAYGARALNEGGWQSIPKLNFPGGALIGCSAGFVNVPKIKGTHTAMKSGILAAEEIVKHGCVTDAFEREFKASWAGQELWRVRNYRPAFHRGLWTGLAYSGLEAFVLQGRAPWTLSHGSKPDHDTLKPAIECKPINYPKADGKLTFELLESVSRTGTNHEEDQPCHLQLQRGPEPQLQTNLPRFAGPEQRFCPAGVYEYVDDESTTGQKRFQINAQNCIHCKTCDIKDPSQNINWTVPEGGGGPQYTIL